MMQQQLDENSLKLLIDLFNESQIPDNEKQKEVHQKINELSKNPEFSNYIIYILAIRDNPTLNTVRRIAGATLKGVLERNWDKISPQTLNYIKGTLLSLFDDPTPGIRNAVANAITTLFTKIGMKEWPELIMFLEMNLNSDKQDIVESILQNILKIFEDLRMNSENINFSADGNNNPFYNIVLKLFTLCDPQLPPKVRSLALEGLNAYVSYLDPNLLSNYFEILMIYAEDQHAALRQKSCEGLLETYESRKELILHNLIKVLERLVKFTMDNSKDVRKTACRFWTNYLLTEKGENKDRIFAVRKYLMHLVPALVDCLQYTQEDLLNLDNESSQKDRLHQNDEEDANGESEGFDVEYGQTGDWTLRKEAAKALDYISRHFKEEAFLSAQEKIADCLRNPNWLSKESGMLCLGALSHGAYHAIIPHLKDLFPFLMENLSDEQPLVRSIACWTLTKFTDWILDQGRANDEVLKAYLTSILKRMMEDNTQVQEASCAALSKAIYQDGQLVEPYTNDIIQVFKYVSDRYKKKSLESLYDTMTSLACNVAHSKIQNSDAGTVLIEIVAQKWNESQFNDNQSIYLVECTDAILTALEDRALAHVEFFLGRALYLIFNYIQARNNDDKKHLYHKREIALRSFEIFGTFLKVANVQTDRYVSPTDCQHLIKECLEDPDIVIRQFILSSIGEMAKLCPKLVTGCSDLLANGLMNNLVLASEDVDPDATFQACCNNATWSVGECTLAFPSEFTNYASAFATRFCDLLGSNLVTHRNLNVNLSIALGRLSFVNSDVVAPLLERFLKPFCQSLRGIKSNQEKQQAFRGLFLAISKNPNGIVKDFVFLCQALVTFENADFDLQELATKLIVNFKAIAGQLWYSYFDNFPKELQDSMRQRFGV